MNLPIKIKKSKLIDCLQKYSISFEVAQREFERAKECASVLPTSGSVKTT